MICSGCVTPDQLKKLIQRNGRLLNCQYCHNPGTVVEQRFLFDHILKLVDENIASEDDLSPYELNLIYEGGSDGIAVQGIDIVLAEWLNLGEEPYFDDLMIYIPQAYLKNEHNQERHFFFDDGDLERNIYEDKWEMFVTDIRHSHRFFNPNAKNFLDSVFSFLSDNNSKLKPEAVRILVKGHELYRARSVADYAAARKVEINPASELGATPKHKAGSQRMTPNGISALYCALERETCLSEIRAITGDNVVSGAFTPTTQLKLLDLTKLALVELPQLTLFDEGFREALHLKTFLVSLVKKISKPKGRNDELGYLSTQVVFEYLRLRFGSQVDGLLFPSVQTGEIGTNVALFPESNIVSAKHYTMPDDVEEIFGDKPTEDFEPQAKLAVVAGSIRFHKVMAIETKAKEYPHISELFMSDLVRKQLGLPPA